MAEHQESPKTSDQEYFSKMFLWGVLVVVPLLGILYVWVKYVLKAI
jgi:hypothetical protein